MKKKILSIIIAIFTITILFCMQEVQAVGRVAQLWPYDVDGDKNDDLLFRTYTGPHISTVYNYQNITSNISYIKNFKYNPVIKSGSNYKIDTSKTNDAKWVKNTTKGIPSCSQYLFKTIGLRFHWKPYNEFITKSEGTWGYSYNNKNNVLTKDLSTINEELNNRTWLQFDKCETINTEASNHIMYVYNTILEGNKLSPRTITEYRYTIITKKVNGDLAEHIYVADNVIYNKNTRFKYKDGTIHERNDYKSLVAALLNNEKKMSGYMNDVKVYVSNVIISQAVDSKGSATGKYDVMKTASQVVNEKNKTYSHWGWHWWGGGTRGVNSHGIEAVFNLFDNIVKTSALTKRTVWVRHLNVGEYTSIDSKIVAKAIKLTSDSDPKLYRTKDGKTYKAVSMNNEYKNDTWSEKYSDKLYITYGFRKTAYGANNTDENKVTLKFIGSNYATENSSTKAVESLKSKISKKKMDENKTITVKGKGASAVDDYTVMDFYYTTYDKAIKVNHILVDENGVILKQEEQNLPVNESAKEGKTGTEPKTKLKRYNTSMSNVTERYKKKLGYDILVSRLADNKLPANKKGEKTKYIGYQTYKEETKVNYEGKANYENTAGTFKFTGNGTDDGEIIQINFYYQKLDDTIFVPKPNISIPGRVFINSQRSKNIACTDKNTSIEITTVPVNTVATVGIYDLPQYILGGIETVDKTVNGSINITFSNKTLNIPYTAIYNKVDSVAMYRITNITLDDTEYKIFNWHNDQISLTGPNISKTVKTDLQSGNVKISLLDSNGNEVKKVTLTSAGNVNFNMSNKAYSNNYKIQITSKNDTLTLNDKVVIKASGNTKKYGISSSNINLEKEQIQLEKDAKELYLGTKGIPKTMITEDDYTKTYKIQPSIENGIKTIEGKVTYTSFILYGNPTKDQLSDNMYYGDPNKVYNLSIGSTLTRQYSKSENVTEEAAKIYELLKPINIHTPITVSAGFKNETVNNTETLQAGEKFKITMNSETKDSRYKQPTTEFAKTYYVKFNFDVSNVIINGSKRYNKGMLVEANEWIEVPANSGNTYIEAKAQAITTEELTYDVRVATVNVREDIADEMKKYDYISAGIPESIWNYISQNTNNICLGPNEYTYFAETSGKIEAARKIFDFRITDLKDINWKNVFRTASAGNVNKHKGVVYYSGNKYFNELTSSYITRTNKQLGTNPIKTLPLGPFKNTNTSIVAAPKIGYRFSFDVKVSDTYINTNRKVNINTEFYYISKDGKTYYKESIDGKDGIYLFYKNSNGKYVKIDSGIDTLKFVPNDGYRLIEGVDRDNLSKKEQVLGNYRNITLTNKMVTVADNNLYTTYYGEYKVPNSTIAVLVKDGKYNLNKPLKDGYLGVKFNISSNIDGENKAISDYSFLKEGFLSNKKTIKLEKGNWNLTDERYKEISQTVILYDLDNRAAGDFD